MMTDELLGLRCKTCGNTELFKRRYFADITETITVNKQGYVSISDTDINDLPNYAEDLYSDDFTCMCCLSDDIDKTGIEELVWLTR